jgi:hypothetical protein
MGLFTNCRQTTQNAALSLNRLNFVTEMEARNNRLLFLVFAGILSLILTWLGLMGMAFSEPGYQNPIAVTLTWLIPLLSLPLLGAYSFWKAVHPAIIWGLVMCQWVSFSWLNWDSYLHGDSTTSNPILISLSGGIAFPVWCWVGIAILCQCEYSLRSRM